MSRILIHCTDEQGKKVTFLSSEKEGKEVAENYPMYQKWLAENGFTQISANEIDQFDAFANTKEETDTGETDDPSYCSIHDVQMKEREGKYGKFYSHGKKEGDEFIWCNGKGWGK